jgi:hypothetical protein
MSFTVISLSLSLSLIFKEIEKELVQCSPTEAKTVKSRKLIMLSSVYRMINRNEDYQKAMNLMRSLVPYRRKINEKGKERIT